MSQHITSAFDRDLETVEVLITRMGGLVEQAILDAASALEAQDEEAAQEVRRADRAIDALEDQLNDEAARIIALRAPMGVDLRAILGVIKISGNLERIGDYAKNMAKRTTVLAGMPQVEGGTAALRRMAREVQRLLKDALNAYVRRDADLAREVLARDAEIDQMYNAAFRELLTFMLEDTRNITPCMHLHFIAKNTERMGDHVTAIAEQVIYMVTGQHPDDDRPKGDATSVDAKISQT
ncbi:phosphate signaling complex protein PhoU [Roseovarius nanhaiticus]|uniref:phosphate signaling complex protein PhoU n=1 Tax=Roseovarius nanhaiticus TaxID=573024 RepID=UPI00249083CB|nr:phosphate signaling complex protein PhoU [Roseovarius nanhaiticus]